MLYPGIKFPGPNANMNFHMPEIFDVLGWRMGGDVDGVLLMKSQHVSGCGLIANPHGFLYNIQVNSFLKEFESCLLRNCTLSLL